MYGKLKVLSRLKLEFQREPLLKYCKLESEDRWRYLTFLFEQVSQPRNTVEHRVKAHYAYCYQQSKCLGLTADDYVAGGNHKQVFELRNTDTARVIKIFHESEEWQREKKKYNQHDCIGQYLLPHEYREYYAVCDKVQVLKTKRSIQLALDQNKINNKKYAKKVMKGHLFGNLHNLGIYEDNLVWIDIGDCEWVF